MPYLPTTQPPNPLGFAPSAPSKDMAMAVRFADEKWRRQFAVSAVSYRPLRKAVTSPPADDPGRPVGEAGTTRFDPLYAEAVDVSMADYAQPHGTSYRPSAVEVFDAPVVVPARVNVEANEDDLKNYGFDKRLDLLVDFPVSILDASGVTPKAGDELVWNGGRYEVKKVGGSTQRWYNTGTALFRGLNCQTKRSGS